MKEQLAAVDVIKDEIQFIDSLKAVMQPDEERVLEVLQQNVPLSHDVLLLQNKKKNSRVLTVIALRARQLRIAQGKLCD